MGIKIGDKMLKNLRFAGDIRLASEDPEEFQTIVDQLNVKNKAAGLEINLSITQVMFNNYIDENNQNIMIDRFQLKVVTSYMYLGQLVSMDFSKEHEVK